jgi:hypothetical protein
MEPRNFLFGAICAAAAFLPSLQFAEEIPECGENILDCEDELPVEELPSKTEAGRRSLIQIGGNYTYVNIKPSNSGAFSGNMGGVQGLYEYRPLNDYYVAVKGMWREGNTTHRGAERSLFDVDVQERMGYTVSSCGKYWLTLFSGAGYRYLGNELTQNGSTMKMNYNEFYIPVGFLTDFKITSVLSLGLYFTWMPQVNSTVNLIPNGGAQWILEKRLVNFLVEMPLTIAMGEEKQYLIIVKPFYEYWQDGASTGVTSSGIPLGLPGNTYNFGGVELNFGFRF